MAELADATDFDPRSRTRQLREAECPGGNAGCRTAQIRGTLTGGAGGDPEPSPAPRAGKV